VFSFGLPHFAQHLLHSSLHYQKQHSTRLLFLMAQQPLGGLGRLSFRGFMITLRHTIFCRTPLDEWSARRRDLYLTTHNTHKRQISMPPAGIRTRNPNKRAAAEQRLRPRGHWDRHSPTTVLEKCLSQMHTEFWEENLKERYPWDLHADGILILENTY
jgi:hypothetical protein